MRNISTKIRKISDNQKVINKFIINDGKFDRYFFGREGALAKKLIIRYTLDFLLWVPLPDNKKIQSLLWLSCSEGHNYLESFLLQFKMEKTDLSSKIEQIKLLPEKVGEDIIVNKPKTLKDFLNLYGKRN